MPGYLGNKSDNKVHHLATMTQDCKIYDVKKVDQVYFTPDTLENAIKEKFTPCIHCIES